VILFACPSCEKKNTGTELSRSSAIGDLAPDFALKDIRGKDVRLSDYKGKVVLLEFWATWCPPCKETVSTLVEVKKKYADRGLIILGISIDDGENLSRRLVKFSDDHKINYSILLSDGNVENAYKVASIPKSFIIDKEGKIVNSHMGYTDRLQTTISEEIDKIL